MPRAASGLPVALILTGCFLPGSDLPSARAGGPYCEVSSDVIEHGQQTRVYLTDLGARRLMSARSFVEGSNDHAVAKADLPGEFVFTSTARHGPDRTEAFVVRIEASIAPADAVPNDSRTTTETVTCPKIYVKHSAAAPAGAAPAQATQTPPAPTPAPARVERAAVIGRYTGTGTLTRNDCSTSPSDYTIGVNASSTSATAIELHFRSTNRPHFQSRTYVGELAADGSFRATTYGGKTAYLTGGREMHEGRITGRFSGGELRATETLTFDATSELCKGERQIVIDHRATR